MAKDKDEVDLLIMIGSSLKVRPVALIPSSIPNSVPQILINREPLPHLTPDVELLGDCDGIINQICRLLGSGWEDALHKDELLSQTEELLPKEEEEEEVSPNSTPIKETSDENPDPETKPEAKPEGNVQDELPKDQSEESKDEKEEESAETPETPDIPWKPKKRQSHALRLPEGKYFFQSPSR